MALSKLKKKVLTLTVTGSMVLGTGVVFAAPNAAENLRQWYYAVFSNSVNPEMNNIDSHFNNQFAAMQGNVTANANSAANYLTGYSQPEIDANASITALANKHISDITAAKKDLIDNYIPYEYELYLNNTKNDTTNKISEQSKAVINSVTSIVNTAGDAAVSKVEKNVAATKNDKVAALTKAVEDAKAELLVLTSQKTAEFVNAAKGDIDTKIADKQQAINDLIDQLKAAQKSAIEQKAQNIEQQAEAALNAAVANGVSSDPSIPNDPSAPLFPDYQY